ncbi:MAG: SDR family oxidoreductase [Spirochaetia bacterium]|nr:SDR family oxidoreductase [Spirochaetia bacterium]
MFTNKTVLITGGSSGIGLALACQLRQRNASVIVLSRSGSKLKAACLKIDAIPGSGSVMSYRADVRSFLQIRQVVRTIEKTHQLDCIINSAGMVQPARFKDQNLSAFKRAMNANFQGTVNVCKAVAPFMLNRKGGMIVNIGSLAGFIGVYGYTAYSASKFAVHGFTQALRAEMKPHGVHVMLVAPPDTDTPMLHRERTLMPPETAAINDSAGMLSAEHVALQIIHGIKKKRKLVVPGFEGKFAYLASRFIPGIVDLVMDGKIASVRGKRKNQHKNAANHTA